MVEIQTPSELPNAKRFRAFLSPEDSGILNHEIAPSFKDNLETVCNNLELIQETMVNLGLIVRNKEVQLNAAKEKINILEDAGIKSKNYTERLRAEHENYKKAFKLAKAEIELLRKSVVYSSAAPDSNPVQPLFDTRHLNASGIEGAGVDNLEEIRKIPGTLHECYYRCVEENRQLKMEVGMQRIKLESCQDQYRLSQKKLNDENMELKTKLHEMEGMLDMFSKQLEEKTDDMLDMESLNQVLVLKERLNNDELQEARIELISGVQDFLNHNTVIGIKRMGELDQEPFREMCMQKFSTENWDMKSAELCSLWQDNIKNPQWFPFKTIQKINGTFDEVIDDNDDKLKQLKDTWGEKVYKAVCVALSEMNEYNPSTRYEVLELWNLKENRKARLKEVIEYLLKRLESLKKAKRRR